MLHFWKLTLCTLHTCSERCFSGISITPRMTPSSSSCCCPIQSCPKNCERTLVLSVHQSVTFFVVFQSRFHLPPLANFRTRASSRAAIQTAWPSLVVNSSAETGSSITLPTPWSPPGGLARQPHSPSPGGSGRPGPPASPPASPRLPPTSRSTP